MQFSVAFLQLALASFALSFPGPAAMQESELEKRADEIPWSKLPAKDIKLSDVYQLLASEEGGNGESSSELVKRTPGGIYITTDINWQGTKGYKVQPFNVCIVLDAPWLYTISSFGPDQGTRCTLYQKRDCTTSLGAITIWYPGSGDLRNLYGQNWNDRIGSFKCWEDWTIGPSTSSVIGARAALPTA